MMRKTRAMKRRGRTPVEDRLLDELAQWLVVRRAQLIKALINDIANDLDSLTDRKFLQKAIKDRAEMAFHEIAKNLANESFTDPTNITIDRKIDILVRDLE